MAKLSIFLLLTILINITWAGIPGDTLTRNSLSDEAYIETLPSENVAEIEVGRNAVSGDGESVTTPVPIELDSSTENKSQASAVEQENESTNTEEEHVTTDVAIEQETTTEIKTTNINVVNPVTAETIIDNESTTEKETTHVNAEENVSELNKDVDATTNSPAETQATTATPTPVCSTAGVQAHENDCRQYYECSLNGSQNGTLITKTCPEKQAFSPVLKRCSREISFCHLDFKCTIKGSIDDPASNSSYYYCHNHYNGTDFYLFHIDCETYQTYSPLYGRCLWNSAPLPGGIPPLSLKATDADAVVQELKTIKREYKLKLKEIKEQKKAEQKLQKEREKEAKNQAKAEEKRKKAQIKQEAATFVCEREGNSASHIRDDIYILCVIKKDKFKALSMQCAAGTTFNPETGTCGIAAKTEDNSVTSDDEDED